MEVATRFGMSFILLKNVENKPGVAAEIMNALYRNKIRVEYFHGVGAPLSKTADIMLIIPAEDGPTTLGAIKNIKDRIGLKEKPIFVTGLTGISIRGIVIRESSEILNKAFDICRTYGINIIMAYTTYISVVLLVETERVTTELLEAFEREFK